MITRKDFEDWGKTILIAGGLLSLGGWGIKTIGQHMDLPGIVEKMQTLRMSGVKKIAEAINIPIATL